MASLINMIGRGHGKGFLFSLLLEQHGNSSPIINKNVHHLDGNTYTGVWDVTLSKLSGSLVIGGRLSVSGPSCVLRFAPKDDNSCYIGGSHQGSWDNNVVQYDGTHRYKVVFMVSNGMSKYNFYRDDNYSTPIASRTNLNAGINDTVTFGWAQSTMVNVLKVYRGDLFDYFCNVAMNGSEF